MTDTQQQLAASRMLTARLHVALKTACETIAALGAHTEPVTRAAVEHRLDDFNAALEHNEPEILALLADADRDAKVERLNAAAKAMVEACTNAPGDVGAIAAVNLALPALQEALLP